MISRSLFEGKGCEIKSIIEERDLSKNEGIFNFLGERYANKDESLKNNSFCLNSDILRQIYTCRQVAVFYEFWKRLHYLNSIHDPLRAIHKCRNFIKNIED